MLPQRASRNSSRRGRIILTGAAVLTVAGAGAVALAKGGLGPGQIQLPTTLEDFKQPGTQPDPTGTIVSPVLSATGCGFCHGDYLPEEEAFKSPFNGWIGSVMAHSARDPVWHAALTIANQDANLSGEYCIRCHAPGAWLAGRSDNADITDFTSTFNTDDFDGVNCHMCHRLVSPVDTGDSPVEDAAIIAALADAPGSQPGNAQYIVDPNDIRRGPYQDIADDPNLNMHGVDVIHSPWHRRSELCATCHEVANPAYTLQPDGTYLLNPVDEQHPTGDPHDMFVEQTLYSEWEASQFANGGVDLEGRFGGENVTTVMQECQDCHMPDRVTGGCFAYEFEPFSARPDIGEHTFAGSNTWILKAVRGKYPDSETRLSQEVVDDAVARNTAFMQAASDTLVRQTGSGLQVRVVNYSGHRLPAGYPEGRRMWVNVQYYDATDTLIDERGEYDFVTAELHDEDTKVYEIKTGISADVAAATNLPVGESLHLVLNNVRLFDNRIPAIGFTNAGYEAFNAPPVNYTYEDGQYWDDTSYSIPKGATRAVVNLYHQPMTKEYIEFLRDTNVTDTRGQEVYDLWADPLVGNKVPPTTMDSVEIVLGDFQIGDLNGDTFVNFTDLVALLAAWGPCPPPTFCPADFDGNGMIDFSDLVMLLAAWGS